MSIELHIERLVVDQSVLGAERPGALRATIERELARQLGQPVMHGLPGLGGAIDALPWTALPASRRPHDLGARIAEAAATGLRFGRATLP